MRKIDICAAIFLMGVVAVVVLAVIPAENTGGVWHGLSPYFYPAVMLGGIAVSSIGLLVQAWTKPDLYDDQPNPVSLSHFGFFLLSALVVLAGVVLIDKVGFLYGGPVLIAATMVFMGEKNPIRIVPVAVGTVAVIAAIASFGLKTPLP